MIYTTFYYKNDSVGTVRSNKYTVGKNSVNATIWTLNKMGSCVRKIYFKIRTKVLLVLTSICDRTSNSVHVGYLAAGRSWANIRRIDAIIKYPSVTLFDERVIHDFFGESTKLIPGMRGEECSKVLLDVG